MCGIAPYHIRVLCEGGWEGGSSYTPGQVGDMTLDEIMLMLCDKKVLRRSGNTRTMEYEYDQIPMLANKEGQIKGRTSDGRAFYARYGGESLARRLMREQGIAPADEEDVKEARREKKRQAIERAMEEKS